MEIYRKDRSLLAAVVALALILSGFAAISLESRANFTKTLDVVGFAEGSTSLSPSMQRKISRFVKANSDLTRVACVGFSDRFGSASVNLSLGKARGQVGCLEALKHNNKLKVSKVRGKWEQNAWGSNIRRVKITLAYSENAKFVTSFDFAGGSGEIASHAVKVGETMLLPSATMPDHVFAGWYSHETEGVFIGSPGDPYTPDGNTKIFARWVKVQPSSQSVVSVPEPPSPEAEPEVEPEPTSPYTITGTGGLSLVFGPKTGSSNQYIWFCSPGVQASVCVSPNTTVSGTGLKIQKVDPMSYANATGVFNVTVRAPGNRPAGYVIGPGAGLTCTMRNGGPLTGTANGTSGPDWTGSGFLTNAEKTVYGFPLNELAAGQRFRVILGDGTVVNSEPLTEGTMANLATQLNVNKADSGVTFSSQGEEFLRITHDVNGDQAGSASLVELDEAGTPLSVQVPRLTSWLDGTASAPEVQSIRRNHQFWQNYWFTGCSFDQGVIEAEFYNEYRVS